MHDNSVRYLRIKAWGVEIEMDGKVVKLPWWWIFGTVVAATSGPVIAWRLPEILTALGRKDLQPLAIGALLTAAIAFVGKAAVNHFFSVKVETHRSELKQIADQHSIRFQALHSERAEIIKECYARLADLNYSLATTLKLWQPASDPPLLEKVKGIEDAFNAFRDYYVPRRIFLVTKIASCSTLYSPSGTRSTLI
jgi:hypothetical protein